ncbi:MAG TPA: hypothetical protein PKD00_04500 [Burkholderiales bacterium]|nr:hypothetical protein [Burkholderiales bacterium]
MNDLNNLNRKYEFTTIKSSLNNSCVLDKISWKENKEIAAMKVKKYINEYMLSLEDVKNKLCLQNCIFHITEYVLNYLQTSLNLNQYNNFPDFKKIQDDLKEILLKIKPADFDEDDKISIEHICKIFYLNLTGQANNIKNDGRNEQLKLSDAYSKDLLNNLLIIVCHKNTDFRNPNKKTNYFFSDNHYVNKTATHISFIKDVKKIIFEQELQIKNKSLAQSKKKYNDGRIYYGELMYGVPHGKGATYYPKGNAFAQGQFVDGLPHGEFYYNSGGYHGYYIIEKSELTGDYVVQNDEIMHGYVVKNDNATFGIYDNENDFEYMNNIDKNMLTNHDIRVINLMKIIFKNRNSGSKDGFLIKTDKKEKQFIIDDEHIIPLMQNTFKVRIGKQDGAMSVQVLVFFEKIFQDLKNSDFNDNELKKFIELSQSKIEEIRNNYMLDKNSLINKLNNAQIDQTIIFFPRLKRHTTIIEYKVLKNDEVELSIYNSGSGLKFHEKSASLITEIFYNIEAKAQTRKNFIFKRDIFNQQIAPLINNNTEVDHFYKAMKKFCISSPKLDKIIWQKPQVGGSCSVEAFMAYFKNLAGETIYNKFQLEMLKVLKDKYFKENHSMDHEFKKRIDKIEKKLQV